MTNPKYIDITLTISDDLLVYPGDPQIKIEQFCQIGDKTPFSLTKIKNFTTHFGTHLDAPSHFIKDGLTIDQIKPDRLFNQCLIIELKDDKIIPSNIPDYDLTNMSILFKTQNSERLLKNEFIENYVYISNEAAIKLTAKKVNLVGLDYLTIDKFDDESFCSHQEILKNNILILEGIDLSQVEPGRYQLIVLPLKIKDGDGSPVRAILVKD